jgi:hypothetical protein
MTPDRRRTQQELANKLHDSIGSYEVQSILDLLRSLRAENLEMLATCEEARFKEYQGRVRAFDEIERMITRPPIRSK